MSRFGPIPLLIWCVAALLPSVRADAQVTPSPPLMMVPSDSTVPPPDGFSTVPPPGPDAFGGSDIVPSAPNFGQAQGYGPTQGPFTWQLLPDGLMYPSYLAGEREPRLGSEWVYERQMGWIWNIAMGARVGLLRFGTEDSLLPEGVQLDAEVAAFPRLQLNYDRDLAAVDFRGGAALTSRTGPWETKFSIYHLSSHLGDQYMLATGATRLNFSRNAVVLGLAFRPIADVRLYGEVGWAFYDWGDTDPWEFQFGIEYSPARPTGPAGAPFFAVNGHLRQEVQYGGALTVQTGWQWRGRSGHLFRTGLEYFNGKSEQYQFTNQFEQQIGVGIWYDF